jgi:hypothetical protein
MFCPREALTHERTGSRAGSGLAFRHELNARSGSGLVEQGDVALRFHGNSTDQVPERFRIIETFRILAQIFYSGLCRLLGSALH